MDEIIVKENAIIKRNIERFSNNFMLQLTDEESQNIRFQLETKRYHVETRGGKYNNPYVFTETGVTMPVIVQKKIKK